MLQRTQWRDDIAGVPEREQISGRRVLLIPVARKKNSHQVRNVIELADRAVPELDVR
jgi:hypothetical protein